jgi:hypothetical protein
MRKTLANLVPEMLSADNNEDTHTFAQLAINALDASERRSNLLELRNSERKADGSSTSSSKTSSSSLALTTTNNDSDKDLAKEDDLLFSNFLKRSGRWPQLFWTKYASPTKMRELAERRKRVVALCRELGMPVDYLDRDDLESFSGCKERNFLQLIFLNFFCIVLVI